MDVNVLIICITVVIGLLIAGATTLACVEKNAELHRPRSFAEIIGGLPSGESGEDDE